MEARQVDDVLAAARLARPASPIRVTGHDPVLATAFPVGEAAAVALALAGSAAAALWELKTGREQTAVVDVRAAAASLIGFMLQRLEGASTPRPAEASPLVAMYECADGRWIHLHGALPGLAAGTLDVLGCDDDAASVASAVRRRPATDLEDALAARGTCGAIVRTADEWAAHPQGRALAALPAVEIERIGDAPPEPLPAGGDQPLAGVRALDLTRILAGPTCGRTLAQHGAEVLLVNAPSLPNVAPFVLDTSHGKRSAYIDLDRPSGPETLRGLAASADVFAQGYRSGALGGRGFGPGDLARIRPGIIYVSINCYGHTGPWEERPGWEQLAQSATGVVAAHSAAAGAAQRPQLIPAAACDYTTGYLAAWGVMEALRRRATEGGSWHVKASLAQTAMWLTRIGPGLDPARASGIGDVSRWMTSSETSGGTLTHLGPLVDLPETPARWTRASPALGADPAVWLD